MKDHKIKQQGAAVSKPPGRSGDRPSLDRLLRSAAQAGDQAQRAARWAGQYRPIGIFFLSYLARIFQDEYGSGFHLFGNPLVENAQFADHHASPRFRLRSLYPARWPGMV